MVTVYSLICGKNDADDEEAEADPDALPEFQNGTLQRAQVFFSASIFSPSMAMAKFEETVAKDTTCSYRKKNVLGM